ncbi:MAG: PAS domain S-box protein [Candidatus Thermochlorobacter sp.]
MSQRVKGKAIAEQQPSSPRILASSKSNLQRTSTGSASAKKANENIKAKELYSGLFEDNPTPMWIYDEEALRFLAVNKAAVKRYGYSRREFLSMTIAEIRPPETVPAMLKTAQQIRKKKKAYTGLWKHQTKKGEVFTAEIHSHRIKFGGKPARLVIAFDVTERVRLEKEIFQRDERLQLFFNQALEGFYFMMLDEPIEWHNAPDKEAALDYIFTHQRMTEANDAILAQYGLSREEFLGRTPADFYAHDLEYGRRIWRENLDHGAQIIVTHERRADGTPIWIEGHYTPLFNREGKFIGHFGVQRDITERKKIEDALRVSEERYYIAAKHTGQLVYDLDITSGKISWAGAIEQVTGFSPKEFANVDLERWSEYVHTDDRAEAIAKLNEAIHTAKPYNAIYRFRRKEGIYIYVEDSGDCLVDATGKAYRLIGTMKDITERKKAETLLREQALLIDSVRDAIIVRSFDDCALFWSKSAERVYGYSANEVIGKTIAEIIWEEHGAAVKQLIQTVLKEGYWSGELQKRHKSGAKVMVECRWTLTYDEQGKPKAIVSVETDITEQRRLQLQFLQSQRLDSLGRLAGSIAHDLNNILTPMSLSVELLSSKLTDEKSQSWLRTLQRNLDRGTDLVRQVLLFARGSEGQLRPTNLTDVLDDMKLFIQNTFPKNIVFETHVASDLPSVMADATQIYQVLLNLAINARDAMPKGGTLRLNLERCFIGENDTLIHIDAKVGEYVLITVSDTGTGMSPEVLDKIFEPFFTTKEMGKGTGLGLSTVFSIVKNHRGFITVYSELGRGTVFKVYLPALAEKEARSATTTVPTRQRSGQGRLVLIIDDEDAICESAKMVLTVHGYTVLTAQTGKAGLELFKAHQDRVAVAIVDMTMPGIDGVTTVQALRALEPNLKIIAASGFMDSERLAALKRENVETFLYKPFEAAKLLQLLSEILP